MLTFGLILALGFAVVLVWRFRHDLRLPGLKRADALTARAAGPAGRVRAWILARVRSMRSEAEPSPVAAVVAEHVATRAIPSVMADPVLGPPPEPADLATGNIPVPAPWAALAQWIGTREPETDMELRMFSDGDAAGALAVADAYHAYADLCLNDLGLSPAYVAGVLEAGDSAGSHATVVAQVHKRFGVIYGAIKEWVGAHGPLPHRARDFLTEDGT